MHLSTEDAAQEVACCVILAAGEGSRLSAVGNGSPKPTTKILGVSLGERVMLACMDSGVHRFIIVLGAQAEAVRVHFEHVSARRGCAVEFVVATEWQRGNGISALAARDRVRGDACLLRRGVGHGVQGYGQHAVWHVRGPGSR